MSFLNALVASPLAAALGWTLLHSLWEGAILAAVVAAVLLTTRSPRLRYAVALAALALLIAACSLTLLRMIPEHTQGLPNFRSSLTADWNLAPTQSRPPAWYLDLQALAPWLAPFWMVGVLIC